MPQQVDSSVETPEALLQMIDLQIAAQRAKRRGTSEHRGAMLALGLLLILGGGMVAFAWLFISLTHSANHQAAPKVAVSHQH